MRIRSLRSHAATSHGDQLLPFVRAGRTSVWYTGSLDDESLLAVLTEIEALRIDEERPE